VAERRGRELAAADASLPPHYREPRTLEHIHVLRDGGQRHREVLRDLADRAFAARELREDGAPCGIRERTERRVQQFFSVNHMVYY
jgi:hypothetical protein